MTRLESANKYIKENMARIKNRPLYHLTPQIGWMNDPNGFSEYNGEYHLFYQYFPYDTKWNDMHWAHATTKDFINWEYQPVALANDTLADANGVFSGSAIEKAGDLFLIYTGHIDPNLGYEANIKEVRQHQCLAKSSDGVNFTKYDKNPIIDTKELPQGYMVSDFRDPKVWQNGDYYYCICAVKNNLGRGELLLYKSKDLYSWEFVGVPYKTKSEENTMLECPDLFNIDGKDVLIYSVMAHEASFVKDIGNQTEYQIGKLDYITGEFKCEKRGKLDFGDSYYAPQTTHDSRGRRILVAWLKKWTSEHLNIPKDFEWNGMMSLPRELSIENDILKQKVVAEVEANFEKIKELDDKNQLLYDGEIGAYKITLNIDGTKDAALSIFDDTKLTLRDGRLIYESSFYNRVEVVDLPNYLNKENLQVDLYLDFYSLEVFLDGGSVSASFTNFNEEKKVKLELNKGRMVSRGSIQRLKK